jgi:hypothetical protein
VWEGLDVNLVRMKVINGDRPEFSTEKLKQYGLQSTIINVIQQSWSINPVMRPSFEDIVNQIQPVLLSLAHSNEQ